MKRLKFFIGAAALAAVALTASPEAFAQEDGNRDENGKIVRGPYETNRFGDNWFVSAGGGIDLFMNEGYKTKLGLDLDANVGKWFTPSVGMRIGYSGVNANCWSDTPSELGRTLDTGKDLYQQKFGYMYIKTSISGYTIKTPKNSMDGKRYSQAFRLFFSIISLPCKFLRIFLHLSL